MLRSPPPLPWQRHAQLARIMGGLIHLKGPHGQAHGARLLGVLEMSRIMLLQVFCAQLHGVQVVSSATSFLSQLWADLSLPLQKNYSPKDGSSLCTQKGTSLLSVMGFCKTTKQEPVLTGASSSCPTFGTVQHLPSSCTANRDRAHCQARVRQSLLLRCSPLMGGVSITCRSGASCTVQRSSHGHAHSSLPFASTLVKRRPEQRLLVSSLAPPVNSPCTITIDSLAKS